MAPVTYADGVTPVHPGDRVSVRLFFRRRAGEVVYVPGISRRRATYDHNGLTWVGISLADGWAVGEIVLPDAHKLKPSVRFLGRGTESPEGADAVRRIDAQEEKEEKAEREVDEARPGTAVAERPRFVDWVAAGASMTLHLVVIVLVLVLVIAAVRLLWRAL